MYQRHRPLTTTKLWAHVCVSSHHDCRVYSTTSDTACLSFNWGSEQCLSRTSTRRVLQKMSLPGIPRRCMSISPTTSNDHIQPPMFELEDATRQVPTVSPLDERIATLASISKPNADSANTLIASIVIQGRTEAIKHAMNAYENAAAGNKLVLWTDGSYSSENHEGKSGCGVAIVWRASHNHDTGWHKSGYHIAHRYQSGGAELFAIAKALEIALDACEESKSRMEFGEIYQGSPISTVIIYTDSESSLLSIQKHQPSIRNRYCSTHRLKSNTAGIHQRMQRLLEMNVSLELRWVPGHAGVQGNMLADSLARKVRKNSRKFSDKAGPVALLEAETDVDRLRGTGKSIQTVFGTRARAIRRTNPIKAVISAEIAQIKRRMNARGDRFAITSIPVSLWRLLRALIGRP